MPAPTCVCSAWARLSPSSYLAHSAFRKGTGDAKVPLLCIAAAAAINLLLDLLLVGILALGTVGAAYATVASQGASLLLSLSLGRGQDGAVSRRPRFTLRRQPLAAIVKIGLPTALQMMVVNLSYCILAGMCNTFGVSVAAAAGIGLKVNTLVAMPCWSLGQAVTAMVGQNTGAGAMDRVRKITRTGLWCGLASTLILLLLVHRFSLPILQLFGSDSPEVLSAGVLYFQICCGVNSLFYTAMYLLDSFAIGLGHAKVALVNALWTASCCACLSVGVWPSPRLGLSRSVDRAGHLSPAPRPHRGMVLPPHRWKLPHPHG
ncbi:MAG: MATE family efflux transporter [Evtepia gabavorous]